jgi:hypothetical protein
MRIIFIGASMMLLPCAATADPQPTATEVFHLRTECKRPGDQLFQQEALPDKYGFSVYHSNYDKKSNRCYVEISNRYKDNLSGAASIFLYDGQGGGLIATCFPNSRADMIRGRSVTHDEACAYIQSKMDAG